MFVMRRFQSDVMTVRMVESPGEFHPTWDVCLDLESSSAMFLPFSRLTSGSSTKIIETWIRYLLALLGIHVTVGHSEALIILNMVTAPTRTAPQIKAAQPRFSLFSLG